MSWPLVVGVAALAVLPYVNALRNGFVLDDVSIIVRNPLIRHLTNAGAMLQTDYWRGTGARAALTDPGLYRPLTIFSYAVDYRLWGLSAPAYHAVNVVLHAAASIVVLLVAAELVQSPMAALAAAAIFAVHPVHTEAVTGIVGRAEVLAALFFLVAFWLARLPATGEADDTRIRRWRTRPLGAIGSIGVAAVCYLLGMLAKETAVTLPAVLALDDWLRRSQWRGTHLKRLVVWRYAALGVALAVYVALRLHAVSARGNTWPGFAGVSGLERFLTGSRVLLEYLGLFVFPRTLLADYWKPDVPIARSALEPLVLLSLATWIAIVIVALNGRWRAKLHIDGALWLSVGWIFITILPVSNLFFPIGVGKAERILYLPSVGLCLVIGWLYARCEAALPAALAWIPRAALAAALIIFAGRTYARNFDWRDNLTLAGSSLRISPMSPLMNDVAAGELVNRGLENDAVPLLQTALRAAPAMPLLHDHLGAAYYRQKLLDAAIAQYDSAIRLNPSDADAHTNLAVVYLDRQETARAESELLTALRLDSTSADAHINLGTLYLDERRIGDAIRELTAALRANPESPEAHNDLGVAYLRSGQPAPAIEEFRQALQLRPDYASARRNLEALTASRPPS